MAGFFEPNPAMKSAATLAAVPKADTGPEMKGSDAVVECLIREGVEVVFAYPGGASQELHQSLARTDKIRVILPRHEQGGSFAAEGYARATGKVGVCMATSGPGATNLVSAIADAYMDSIPLVAITGQVMSRFIGKMAFQETDFFGMTLPVEIGHVEVHRQDGVPGDRFLRDDAARGEALLPRDGRPRAPADHEGGVLPGPERPAWTDRRRHTQGRPAGEVKAGVPRGDRLQEPIRVGRAPGRRRDAEEGPRARCRGREARDLRRRRHRVCRRPQGAPDIRRRHPHRRRDDAHGPGHIPRVEPALDAVVRDAWRRLRQLGRGPVGPAAGLRRHASRTTA